MEKNPDRITDGNDNEKGTVIDDSNETNDSDITAHNEMNGERQETVDNPEGMTKFCPYTPVKTLKLIMLNIKLNHG